jgi:lipoprotein-anchoring transpeptidase ErfK/SrfK
MTKTAAAMAAIAFLLLNGPECAAQGWPPWVDEAFGTRPWGYERQPRWQTPQSVQPGQQPRLRSDGANTREGGARPDIAPAAPPVISFAHDFPINSIIIDTGGRKLYYVLNDNRAFEYPISVGREGFSWTGTETISRKQPWPDWYPPVEMRERDPKLPEKMTGGMKNPLGAMALYLGTTLYRIHGTDDARSIGRAASSGCFRMLNAHVLHLASITEIGTTVNVVKSLPERQISRAPELSPEAASAARTNREPQPPPSVARAPERPPAPGPYPAPLSNERSALADRIARARGHDVLVVLRRKTPPYDQIVVRGYASQP